MVQMKDYLSDRGIKELMLLYIPHGSDERAGG